MEIKHPDPQANEHSVSPEMESGMRELFIMLGDDPDREGLTETPARCLKFLSEFMSPPEFNFTTFKN